MKRLLTILLLFAAALPVATQTAVPPDQLDHFKDTSTLKPPAGARVAIIEFEDLQCPACADSAPTVRAAVERYKIPYLLHDFPFHPWSLDAAIDARYLQDKVSPKVAENYRRDVFAHQSSIGSKDDLLRYTHAWFKSHGEDMPFVIDSTGQLSKEVNDDLALGHRIGIIHTPSIFVVTQRSWVQVVDVKQLYRTIDTALSQTSTPSATPSHHTSKK